MAKTRKQEGYKVSLSVEQCAESLKQQVYSNFDFRVEVGSIDNGYYFVAEKRVPRGYNRYITVTASGAIQAQTNGSTVIRYSLSDDRSSFLRLLWIIPIIPVLVMLIVPLIIAGNNSFMFPFLFGREYVLVMVGVGILLLVVTFFGYLSISSHYNSTVEQMRAILYRSFHLTP